MPIFLLILISGACLSACAAVRPLPVDPQEARKMVFGAVTHNQPPETAASYKVLGSQAGFYGHVVAYWMCQPATITRPAVSLSGYAIVRSYPVNNTGIQNITQEGAGLPKAGALVEFSAFPQDNPDGKINIVYGRILSPEVQAVEVVYADQQSLRWPSGSGGFLIFRNEPVDWVRLNVLGQNDQILKSYDLAKDATTLSERAEGFDANCPAP